MREELRMMHPDGYGSNDQIQGPGFTRNTDCQNCNLRRRIWTGKVRPAGGAEGSGHTCDVCPKCLYILDPKTVRRLRPEEGGLAIDSPEAQAREKCKEGGERYQVSPEKVGAEGHMFYAYDWECSCGRVFKKLPTSKPTADKAPVAWIPPHGEGPA